MASAVERKDRGAATWAAWAPVRAAVEAQTLPLTHCLDIAVTKASRGRNTGPVFKNCGAAACFRPEFRVPRRGRKVRPGDKNFR